MISFFRDVLITFIIAAIIFFGLRVTVDSIVVDGPSMNPNFQDKQRLLVNKPVYKFFHEPERGDVVIFYPPNGDQEEYIKRIIGLPGESVEIKDGIVYIHQENGNVQTLHEPYVAEQASRPFKGDTIPNNEYFVLGDNRNNSGDSRSGWTVPRQSIVGKAWISIWPPDTWGLAANYRLEEQMASVR